MLGMTMPESGEDVSISLIIPAYNEEKGLGACLDSIQKNAHGLKEIIVVDNASTDRTAEVAQGYEGVRVVREDRKGLVRARQRGYLAATGSVLAYVDADTRLPVGWVEQIEQAFSADPSLACLSGPYSYYDIPRIQSVCVTVWYWFAKPWYWALGYMATGGNIAIRRSVVEAMGGFDTTIEFYGEDTIIARSASKYGRVIFSSRFSMPTSGRRFKEEGFFRIGYLYLINFLASALGGRPATVSYEDVR